MFTLIKREIEDHIAYFIGAAFLSGILIVLSISVVYYRDVEPPAFAIGLSIPVIIVLILGSPAMGVTQMYTDRTRKISAFLSALPVTRGQILAARIVAGILAILTLLVPLTITAVVLFSVFAPPIPMYPGLIFDMFIVTFLMSFACYCLGLLTGWISSKVTPTLGGLALTFLLVPLVLVKGFGLHIVVILLLFIIASLVCIWHKFASTSL